MKKIEYLKKSPGYYDHILPTCKNTGDTDKVPVRRLFVLRNRWSLPAF